MDSKNSVCSIGKPATLTVDLPSEEARVTWSIDNFKQTYTQYKLTSGRGTGSIFRCFDFVAGGLLDMTSSWQIRLIRLRGDRVMCSIFYENTPNNPMVVFANVKVFIQKRKSKEFLPLLANDNKVEKFSKGDSKGQKELKISKLLCEGYLSEQEDILTLKFHATIYGNQNSSVNVDFHALDEFPAIVENPMGYKWTAKMEKEVAENMSKLFETGAGADVKFIIHPPQSHSGQEAHKINAHRGILMTSSSPVFSAMFDSEMAENKTGEIDIYDISPQAMQRLLKFVYCGRVEQGWETFASELIYGANKYELNSLKAYLNENIASILTVLNVREIMEMVEGCNIEMDLGVALEACTKFTNDNALASLTL